MKRAFILSVLVGALALPTPARANHEIQQLLDTLDAAADQGLSTIADNTPFRAGGRLTLDVAAGTWAIDCPNPTFCPLSAQGWLDPDTHVGPVDTASCPVRRGTGNGAIDPRFGLIAGDYDAAELHDLRLTVTAAGAVLEGAWRDDAGRGDRFLAVLTTLPGSVGSLGCPTGPQHTVPVTGIGWAVGVVR